MGAAILLGGLILFSVIYLLSVIEALVYQKMLRIKRTLEATFLANLFTSIIGIFLIINCNRYLDLTALGKIVDNRLGDYFIGEMPTLPKSLYLDYIFFLFIYDVIPILILYFIAVMIKYFVLKMYFQAIESRKLKKSVWIASAVSYLFLTCFKILLDIQIFDFYSLLLYLSPIGAIVTFGTYKKFQKSAVS